MMTVHEVSDLTGVSVRALHHYDRIGLLYPTEVTKTGYRLYDDTALERLQCLMLFKELQFPLKIIKEILDSPDFERNRALEQQITLLQMKKEHLENLIDFARGIKAIGVKKMDFTAFDTKKLDEYARQARESFGQTPEYKEFEEKSKGRTRKEEQRINTELMGILAGFGRMQEADPADETAQTQVKRLQEFITEHFYICSKKILLQLGHMYAGGGTMTENIDEVGGEGTAEYAWKAIEIYCR